MVKSHARAAVVPLPGDHVGVRGKLVRRQDDFTGGMRFAPFDTFHDDSGVWAGNEFMNGLNLTLHRRSRLLVRRNGHALVSNAGALSAAVNSLFGAQGLPAGSANQLIVGAGANVYQYNTATGLSAAIIAGLTANKLLECAQAPVSGGQGPVWMMNSVEARYWTGAVAGTWTASAGTLPLGRFLLWHGTRMWVAAPTAASLPGVADAGSSLCFCALGDPRNWPAANVVSFDPNDGQRISGIGRVGPYLLVFKPNKTWLVYDLDTGANRPLSGEIGCLGHRTIVETPKGTYFWTRDKGLALCDGSQIKLVEDKPGLLADADTSLQTNAAGYWPGEYNAIGYFRDRLYVTINNFYAFGSTAFYGPYEYVPQYDAWYNHASLNWQSVPHTSEFASWDVGDTSGVGLYFCTLSPVGFAIGRYMGATSTGSPPDSGTPDFGVAGTVPDAELYTAPTVFGTAHAKRFRGVIIEGLLNTRTDFRPNYGGNEGRPLAYTVAGQTMNAYEVMRPKFCPPATSIVLRLFGASAQNPADPTAREHFIQAISWYADLGRRARTRKFE